MRSYDETGATEKVLVVLLALALAALTAALLPGGPAHAPLQAWYTLGGGLAAQELLASARTTTPRPT